MQYVNVITARSFTEESKRKDKQAVLLREVLEKVTEHMEASEVKLKAVQTNKNHRAGLNISQVLQEEVDVDGGNSRPVCWICQEEWHIKADCPLNYNRPAGPVGSWPKIRQKNPTSLRSKKIRC